MSTYAVSDLHGQLELYQKIKEFIKPNDTVICLGDCGDRGPYCWETIKAVANDNQFIYLKGNHEDLLVGAMGHILDTKVHIDYWTPYPYLLCLQNGGEETIEGWMKEPVKGLWIPYLTELPLVYTYVNSSGKTIILSHAGPKFLARQLKKFDARPCLWDRKYDDEWFLNGRYENVILVHGHTPIESWKNDWTPDDGVLFYCEGHKVDIDCGSVWTGMTVLLDLDTFEQHKFFVDKN